MEKNRNKRHHGVSQCLNIVQKHHGSIKVKSKVGRGREFIITLPINLTDENEHRNLCCSNIPDNK